MTEMSVNATASFAQESAPNEDRAIAYVQWRLACAAARTAYQEWANGANAVGSLGPRRKPSGALPRGRGCGRLRATVKRKLRAGGRAGRIPVCVGKPEIAQPRVVLPRSAAVATRACVGQRWAGISNDRRLLLQADSTPRSSQSGTESVTLV